MRLEDITEITLQCQDCGHRFEVEIADGELIDEADGVCPHCRSRQTVGVSNGG